MSCQDLAQLGDSLILQSRYESCVNRFTPAELTFICWRQGGLIGVIGRVVVRTNTDKEARFFTLRHRLRTQEVERGEEVW